MPAFLNTLDRSRFRKFFPGKDQHHVSAFILYRHTIGERILSGNPSDVHAKRFIHPSARHVEIFVTKRFDHSEEFSLRLFARPPCNQTNNSRHCPLMRTPERPPLYVHTTDF